MFAIQQREGFSLKSDLRTAQCAFSILVQFKLSPTSASIQTENQNLSCGYGNLDSAWKLRIKDILDSCRQWRDCCPYYYVWAENQVYLKHSWPVCLIYFKAVFPLCHSICKIIISELFNKRYKINWKPHILHISWNDMPP